MRSFTHINTTDRPARRAVHVCGARGQRGREPRVCRQGVCGRQPLADARAGAGEAAAGAAAVAGWRRGWMWRGGWGHGGEGRREGGWWGGGRGGGGRGGRSVGHPGKVFGRINICIIDPAILKPSFVHTQSPHRDRAGSPSTTPFGASGATCTLPSRCDIYIYTRTHVRIQPSDTYRHPHPHIPMHPHPNAAAIHAGREPLPRLLRGRALLRRLAPQPRGETQEKLVLVFWGYVLKG